MNTQKVTTPRRRQPLPTLRVSPSKGAARTHAQHAASFMPANVCAEVVPRPQTAVPQPFGMSFSRAVFVTRAHRPPTPRSRRAQRAAQFSQREHAIREYACSEPRAQRCSRKERQVVMRATAPPSRKERQENVGLFSSESGTAVAACALPVSPAFPAFRGRCPPAMPTGGSVQHALSRRRQPRRVAQTAHSFLAAS